MLTVLGGWMAQGAGAVEAAGDGVHLWIVQEQAENRSLILHRGILGKGSSLRPVETVIGRLVRGGLATGENSVWLVYENLGLQLIRVTDSPATGLPVFSATTATPLPGGITLRNLTAGRDGPWALVHVSNRQTLMKIDNPPRPPEEAEEGEQGDEADGGEGKGDKHLAVSEDRLLHLGPFGWQSFPLPDNWAITTQAHLVMRRAASAQPAIVVAATTNGTTRLTLYQYQDAGWAPSNFTLDGPARPGEIQVTSSEQGFVVARRQNHPRDLEIALMLLRSDGLNPLGAILFPGNAGSPWRLVQVAGQHATGLLICNDQDQFVLAQMDAQGNVTPPGKLAIDLAPRWGQTLDHLVLIVVLTVATLIMFIFWKRDRTWNHIELPDHVALANLSRRATAGALDLLPGLAVMIIGYGISPDEMHQHWPGRQTGGWTNMVPGVVAIVITIAHTCLGELFTARSLGKALLGLRVADLKGQSPNIWQVLVRNLSKGFELIAWFLLILPVLSPYHQRLGDVVAKTVVVMDVKVDQDTDQQKKG